MLFKEIFVLKYINLFGFTTIIDLFNIFGIQLRNLSSIYNFLSYIIHHFMTQIIKIFPPNGIKTYKRCFLATIDEKSIYKK